MAKRFIASTNSFKGLDERAGCSTSVQSLPKLVNMRVNESGSLEKRCGYKVLYSIEESAPINAVWHGHVNGQECYFAACGNGIYISVDDGRTFDLLSATKAEVTCFIQFGGKLYCLGGGLYRCTNQQAYEIEGYVPTVGVGVSTGGAGTMLELPNMLTPKRHIVFSGDGKNVTYALPEKDISSIESIYINGVLCSTDNYALIANSGWIEFDTPPEEGLNNVDIVYTKADTVGFKAIISGCRHAVVFENRLFLYGNPDYPDRVYRSELADGIPSCEYFTELGYHAFEKNVTALIPCYNRLIIFFEDAACFTFAELKTDSLNNTYTSFPVYELHSSKGNIAMGVGCSVENTPITICRDGLNRWVSTAIADERSANVFSERAFKFMSAIDKTYKNVLLFNRKASSELWLCTVNGTLVYNYALDCFYIYELCTICSLYEIGSDLIIGMNDGRVCLFSKLHYTDGDDTITAEFETPYCTFGAPFSVKTLNGVSVSFEGDGAIDANIEFKKGNENSHCGNTLCINLPQLSTRGHRKIQKRVNIKRFYSAKLCFSANCDHITVTDLHLFGKQHEGAIRLN